MIRKQFEKFQKKQPPKKDDFKMKSNKKVGEYIDYERLIKSYLNKRLIVDILIIFSFCIISLI